MQTTQTSGDDGSQSRTCASRRGFAECTLLGPDCQQLNTGATTGITFPQKDWSVQFPCTDGFSRPPMVFTRVLGPMSTKMYSSSVHAVTNTGFGVYIQRTDDVVSTAPAQCDDISVCYIALLI